MGSSSSSTCSCRQLTKIQLHLYFEVLFAYCTSVNTICVCSVLSCLTWYVLQLLSKTVQLLEKQDALNDLLVMMIMINDRYRRLHSSICTASRFCIWPLLKTSTNCRVSSVSDESDERTLFVYWQAGLIRLSPQGSASLPACGLLYLLLSHHMDVDGNVVMWLQFTFENCFISWIFSSFHCKWNMHALVYFYASF